MRLTHPGGDRRVVELIVRDAFDGIDDHAPLPRVAPLAAGHLRRHRLRRHHDNEKFHLIEGGLDLRPPSDPALEFGAILPERDFGFLRRQTASQCGRKGLAVPRAYDRKTRGGDAAMGAQCSAAAALQALLC